ncbi:LPS export ABC transporter periplasmic protein LptC [Rhodobacteraceae bacterium nBUS_24]|nr:LPS export ABC transporter periplasmic protein LptC [Marinovum sp.]MBT4872518.1 LPS export ABC transporter periplasmic protein LptC [Marinovum sp.]MBT6507158.1 LPS export ABC transporter periplasmic protein LptC [Marinovum sp.]MBT6531676.1 LPS export ABC transporter periplasmic protein LptC [Marinovum sp.]MDG2230390.1 LPS export ABC transporter periplasmic protein LptC [Paracoccaceae bacterium]
MTTSQDIHFQLMTGLKYILPMIALGLLSVMFYMSQSVPEESTIPYSERRLYDRAKGPQVSAPYFTGVTGAGDRLSMSAMSVKPDQSVDEDLEIDQVVLRIKTGPNQDILASSDSGLIRNEKGLLVMEGNVQVVTNDGYQLSASRITSKMEALWLYADGPVKGTGAAGVLEAGSMEILRDSETGNLQFIFKDGIKLIYDPKT